jgi:hypothetical protein
MKCSNHQEVDAIGVCSSCGKGLCPQCKLELGGKLYCQTCADKAFTKETDNKVSASYYFLPVFFAFIGGIIAFYVNDNHHKNRNRAKNMLGLGILISIGWFILAVSPYFS